MNIASSVINKDNASLQTMDSDQILEIFDVKQTMSKESSDSNKKATSKDVLETLGELWDSEQYEDLGVDAFLKSMKGNIRTYSIAEKE